MEKDYLILKRASASRPSGEWSDDDYDVMANREVVGRIFKANAAPALHSSAEHLRSGVKSCPTRGGARNRMSEKKAPARAGASRS